MPGGEKMSLEDQMKFINITLTIGNGHTIMATDALESMGQKLTEGDNFHICIQAESEAETERIFNELSDEGKIGMPLNKTFWGAYFGMCQDKFGILWMINYSYPKTK
jgi:PhnB protein